MPRILAPLLSLLLSFQLAAAGRDVSASPATTPQRLPVLAGNGGDFMAAWIEPSPGLSTAMAGRITHDGVPLDGAGITIGNDNGFPAKIARGSSEALVAWSNSDGIFAARLSPLGTLLDTTPIPITRNIFSGPVAVTWDGSRYFVIWAEKAQQIAGAFVSPDGSVTSPKIFLKPAADDHIFDVEVTWNGHEFIVVFTAGMEVGVLCSGCGPFPDNVRVMGVSSSGDAIDTVPIRIPGVHVRGHVASSGAGTLIALDGNYDVTAIQVRDNAGALILGDEVPLFHWFNPVSSDVVWDGAAYTIAWRYFSTPGGVSWIGTIRIGDSGTPFERRYVAAQAVENIDLTFWWGPSIAANFLGETDEVISEIVPPSNVPRARLYFGQETSAWSGLPAAPHDAVNYFSGNTAYLQWQSGGPSSGFVIERSTDFGNTWHTDHVNTPDQLTYGTLASIGNQFRISAFGAGGISAGTITSIASPPRRRAVR
jgi:hypothetical protein